MKQLLWNLILPLTVISMAMITKWWFVIPVDAPDTMMVGFPMAFACDGWHTSMSLQIFLFEFAIDFIFYLTFWFISIYLIDAYFVKIKVPIFLKRFLLTLTVIITSITIFIVCMPEQVFFVKRNWDMKIIETGYKIPWKYQKRPELKKS